MSDEKPAEDQDTEERQTKAMEENLKSRSTWLRLVFMFIFYILLSVAGMVTTVVVVLGFLFVLFTGDTNAQLKKTGQGLATYVSQVLRYLTFNSNDRPFPFDLDWPSGESD